MNFTEAYAAVTKLRPYKGKSMKPFNAPVETFLIIPAEKTAYDKMFRDMYERHLSFEEAIKPYRHNVAVLVCFDMESVEDRPAYCSLDYFLADNNIDL